MVAAYGSILAVADGTATGRDIGLLTGGSHAGRDCQLRPERPGRGQGVVRA
jgi:hypothetical protein